ncbi:hypothetical protein Tco_0312848 [Tanacetum coccineum]
MLVAGISWKPFFEIVVKSQYVSYIEVCVNFLHPNELLLIRISYKVVSDLYVLCLGVIHWILHNADGAFIINVDFGIHEIETIVQHLILNPQQLAAATYSASVVEVATIVYFLHCHEINLLPRN